MKKESKPDQYCCPVGSRSDQDLFDTAQWMGRGTDGVAKRKSDIDRQFRDEEDK